MTAPTSTAAASIAVLCELLADPARHLAIDSRERELLELASAHRAAFQSRAQQVVLHHHAAELLQRRIPGVDQRPVAETIGDRLKASLAQR